MTQNAPYHRRVETIINRLGDPYYMPESQISAALETLRQELIGLQQMEQRGREMARELRDSYPTDDPVEKGNVFREVDTQLNATLQQAQKIRRNWMARAHETLLARSFHDTAATPEG